MADGAAVTAQTDEARRFVPGEILVGYGSQEDRDAAAKELTEPKVQVRGAKVSGTLVQPVGSTIALVRVQFPEALKRGIERDPGAELSLLREFAKNLKEADGRVKYAVPNYVDELPNPSQGLEPHDSGRIELQNLKRGPELQQQSQHLPNDPAFVHGLLWHYQPTPVGMNAVNAMDDASC